MPTKDSQKVLLLTVGTGDPNKLEASLLSPLRKSIATGGGMAHGGVAAVARDALSCGKAARYSIGADENRSAARKGTGK